MGFCKIVLPSVLLALTDFGAAWASDIVWTNTAGGDWNVAANWSPNVVPTAADDAWITNSGTYAVALTTTLSVSSFVLGGGSGTQTLNLSGGTFTVAAGSLIAPGAQMNLSSGALAGSGNLTNAGVLNWTGGTMSGSGLTINAPGGTMNISGTGTKTLSRTLQNDGDVSWALQTDLGMNNGTFNNNGSVTVSNSATLGCLNSGGVNAFNNTGTFTKFGVGELQFPRIASTGVPFNNHGTFTVASDSLVRLKSGGTHTGDFVLVNGSSGVSLAGNHSFASSCELTGAGYLDVGSGTSIYDGTVDLAGGLLFYGPGSFTFTGPASGGMLFRIWGGTVNFNGPTVFKPGTPVEITGGTANLTTNSIAVVGGTFSGGTLTGSGNITNTGVLNWTGGTMSGSGLTVNTAGGTLNLSGPNSGTTRTLGRVLQNDGTVTWTGDKDLLSANAVIQNYGTFTVSNSVALDCFSGSTNEFNNSGAFIKSGTGELLFPPSPSGGKFNNSGTVSVGGGQLNLRGDGMHTGSFTVATASSLKLQSSHYLAASGSISGGGDMGMIGLNESSVFDGPVSLGGGLFFTNGITVTFNGSVAGGGFLRAQSSTLNFNGSVNFDPTATLQMIGSGNVPVVNLGGSSVTFSNATISGGTLAGSGNVTFLGTVTWSPRGTMSGSGQTIVAAGAVMNVIVGNGAGNAVLTLSRTLQNSGTLNWSGLNGSGSTWRFADGVLNNLGGGVVNASSGYPIVNFSGVNAITNAGTWNKIGTSNTTINVAFNNQGMLESKAGTITFSGSLAQSSGSTVLNGGSISSSQLFLIQGGTLSGTGTLAANVFTGATISPGLSPGLLTISGNYTQAVGGVLNIELAGTAPGTEFDRLAVTGTASLAGTVNLSLANGFYPAANTNFVFLTAGNRLGTFSVFSFPANEVGVQLAYTTTNVAVEVINTLPSLPVLSAQTNAELALFSFDAAGSDDDSPIQTLTYFLTNSPLGATIDPVTGSISWTPTEAQGPAETNITVVVTDDGMPNLSVSRTFAIAVNEINVAPTLNLPPNQAIAEQATFSAPVTATDPDLPANSWTFELVSGPPGLTVATNGNVAWTPTELQGPGIYPVTVRVTDLNTNAVVEQSLSATNTFTLTVNEVNQPPALGPLTDYTVNPGVTINFTATATDADMPANGLSFSLINPPPGATINSAGDFEWRPGIALVGSTNQITVHVADDGTPPLGATNSFTVVVNPLSPIVLTPIEYDATGFKFEVAGPAGPDYILMASSNLVQWGDIATNLSPSTPFEFTNANPGDITSQFYRARIATDAPEALTVLGVTIITNPAPDISRQFGISVAAVGDSTFVVGRYPRASGLDPVTNVSALFYDKEATLLNSALQGS